ncbi:MAG: transporter substrate-binding domain-containing protein [Gammaproteobacteria bacterium]
MKLLKLLGLLLAVSLFNPVYAETTTIRFATEATYPPFEFVGAAGKIQGFDVDVASALCAEMKAECTFSNQAFNSLIPGLKLGKFDAVIASLGVTDSRQKQVDFTQTYYEPSASFVAPIAKHETLAVLTGKTIGTQEGTTFVKYLSERYPNEVKVKTYASMQDAFLDLAAGRVDMVLADTPIARAWLKQDKNSTQYSIVDKPIVDHLYFGRGYAIAVRKGNTTLLDGLNKALTTIKANGTYQKIVAQYFGE